MISQFRKTLPVLEVTYLMWSEKGHPAEVDVSMWSPQEGFLKERVVLSKVPMHRTFYIHPDEYRDVDLVLYNRTEGTIVRAQIHADCCFVCLCHASSALEPGTVRGLCNVAFLV